ncbi:MAG: alpha/beta hydrolase [Cyanobacteria bacterium SBLK]|nr:alpha/beta hydrolase [Cyanobacteria bacterium SBLK]
MAKIDILGVPHAYELTPPIPHSQTPVLVFIHGWLLSRHYWCPSIAKLRDRYQCLFYDLRGFGESQLPQIPTNIPHCYTLEAYARDLEILLDKLNISRAWAIGHSLGGSIALWGADLLPDTIEGVICVNAGGGIYLKEEFERFRNAGRNIVKYRPRWLLHFPWLDLLFTRAMVVQPLERHWGKQRLLDFLGADEGAALGSLLETTTESEVHALPQIVARLEQPVYFLAGAGDRVMETRYVRHLASFHPLFHPVGENTIEIPDCGHLAMVERPERVSAEIAAILDRHAPRAKPV